RVEGERVRSVRDVEVNQIGPPFFGNKIQNVFRQVAVGIEERKAFAMHEVLAGEVSDQRGLAGAGLADDVQVGAAVGALDAEATMIVAEVGDGERGDPVVRSWLFHWSDAFRLR